MYTREYVKNLLETNNRAVERAILAINNRQTEGEKIARRTTDLNGVGFSHCHVRLGSYYSDWINKGRPLSGKHLDKARKIALRYVGQLTEVANGISN